MDARRIMADFETVEHSSLAAARPRLLLVTDRPHQARDLARDLGLIGTPLVAALHAAPDPAGFDLLIGDVEMLCQVEVVALRDLAAAAIGAGRKVLCLLREDSYRERVQAGALGAAATLDAAAPREALAETVAGLLGMTGSAAETGVRGTAVLLADLLGAAAEGESPPLEAVPAGAELVCETIRTAGLRAWLDVVWGHDDATYQHCLLVAGFAAAFATGLGFKLADRQKLVGGALLHDIGKARIPLAILDKPGKLTAEEFTEIKLHPGFGHELLLAEVGRGKPVEPEHLAVTRHHHEYLDGSGYPDGLAGEAIPDIVRMMTICDIHSALLERRPYKAPKPPAVALAILREMGPKIDADLLGAFAGIVGGG